MRIFIGYDQDQPLAYEVAAKSLGLVSDITPEPLNADHLRNVGLLTRLVDSRGQRYDLASGAPCSTDFASSRFLVPILCQTGWAMFVDCDVLFLASPKQLNTLLDPEKAVMVVKHNHHGHGTKMGGVVQTNYHRKNWSSVMLFNCDHPSNKRLSLRDVNERPGRDLHAFYWLDDSEIGELPIEWNWLVNITEKPETPKIAHFTNGGPWIKGWEPAQHDDLWNYYRGMNL